MERIFPELTAECERTAIMYCSGLEKKEIADIKCRATSTIVDQLRTAYEKLGIRNGRQLAIILAERLSGLHITFDFSSTTRTVIAGCLLVLLIVNHNMDMRRQRLRSSRSNNNIELICRVKTISRGRNILLTA